jgi:hypothetical protein
VTASFEGPATPGPGTLRLVLVVVRHVPLPVPLSVTLRVPAGARIVQPSGETRLAPNDSARVDRIDLVLELGSVPTSDLVAVLDAQDPGMGVHGEVAYRFGRPEPTVTGPQLADDSLVIGGHNLGRPVVVPPQ